MNTCSASQEGGSDDVVSITIDGEAGPSGVKRFRSCLPCDGAPLTTLHHVMLIDVPFPDLKVSATCSLHVFVKLIRKSIGAIIVTSTAVGGNRNSHT